uniref:PARP-type domain-containing protein n=1 Tax=Dracunculus medinensis TaxID=318479 RepID=A0A0N4UBP8_DRAME
LLHFLIRYLVLLEIRMAKIVPNPFISDSNNPVDMKQYFHVECLFETFTRARLSTKVIESSDDIEGSYFINDDDKAKILEQINNLDEFRKEIEKNTGDELSNVSKNSSQLAVSPEFPSKESVKNNELYRQEKLSRKKENDSQKNNFRSNEKSNKSKFDSFKVFCKLCDVIARVSKCSDKSTAIHMFITRGNNYHFFFCPLSDHTIPDSTHSYSLKFVGLRS